MPVVLAIPGLRSSFTGESNVAELNEAAKMVKRIAMWKNFMLAEESARISGSEEAMRRAELMEVNGKMIEKDEIMLLIGSR